MCDTGSLLPANAFLWPSKGVRGQSPLLGEWRRRLGWFLTDIGKYCQCDRGWTYIWYCDFYNGYDDKCLGKTVFLLCKLVIMELEKNGLWEYYPSVTAARQCQTRESEGQSPLARQLPLAIIRIRLGKFGLG